MEGMGCFDAWMEEQISIVRNGERKENTYILEFI